MSDVNLKALADLVQQVQDGREYPLTYSAGHAAYERDIVNEPNYCKGLVRTAWADLPAAVRKTWDENPWARHEKVTEHQKLLMRWASNHDWGGDPARPHGKDSIEVSTLATYPDGRRVIERATFNTLSALRAWAGY